MASTIAIFDSGVGGLSIFEHVRSSYPNANYVLVCDNLEYPYGEKSEEHLNRRVQEVMRRIVNQFKPDLAVVACNTASTVVLPLLREKFQLPIVGVVPAIKPAAEQSLTREFGLLATPGTVARAYTQSLLNQFASDCTVIKVGSSCLVNMAEAKLYGRSVDMVALETELAPFITNRKCDILVLACTHFPLLNKEIENVFEKNNRDIKIIDSGHGIARRVVQLLQEQGNMQVAPPKNKFFSQAVFTNSIDAQLAFIEKLKDEFSLKYTGRLNE